MRRFFNGYEKKKLFLQAGGRCRVCNTLLQKGWHADHVIPFSLGGQTDIKNGQALCSKCNLSKSNKMKNLQLRDWQQEFYKMPRQAYQKYLENPMSNKHFLLSAGVGSGKTIASIMAALEFEGFNFLIISPSQNVKDKWAKEFLIHANLDIDHDYTFKYHFSPKYAGISITYQALNQDNIDFLIRSKVINQNTLMILDEIHHAGVNYAGDDETKSWGPAINRIGDSVGFVLTLTGTPTRSDNFRIPFCTYEETGDAMQYTLKPDYEYSYADSVNDKVCCPISFTVVDVNSEKTDGYIDKGNKEHSSTYANIFEKDTWISSAFEQADKTLNDYRERFMDNAGGLVVCFTQEQAKRLHKLFPEDSVVITSDENSTKDIEQFSKSDKRWVFSVKMVSEGVDIPRLRVVLFWTRIETMLYFTQVAGRAIRNRKDINGHIDTCRFFLPNILPLVENSKLIESQIKHIIDEQKEDYQQKKERGEFQKIDLFDDFDIEVTAGGFTKINMGIVFDKDIAAMIEEFIPIEKRGTFERIWAENTAPQMPIQSGNDSVLLTRTEQLKSIKKKISSMVYKYASINDEDVKEVHWRLNNRCGIYNQTECEDLDSLKLKLRFITELLNK